MSPITTHVLDIGRGRPARGVPVILEIFSSPGRWTELAAGVTNKDGRAPDLLSASHKLKKGIYRITFDTAAYFQSIRVKGFYPAVSVSFSIKAPNEHYHVPLLLSPFGYSTYRGS